MKDKGFFVLFVIYTLLFVADLTTTLMNYDIMGYVEVNPVFRLLGSLWPVILLNLLMLVMLWFAYRKTHACGLRFALVSSMVCVCAARILAIRNAVAWLRMPRGEAVASAVRTTSGQVVEAQLGLVVLLYAPLLVSLVSYFVWHFDHGVGRRLL